jgi:secretion/DNA translocation related CpaE-like protein
VVTADGTLLDEVLGVAGAAGVAVDVAVDLAAAGPQWTPAPLVLIGYDVARAFADRGLPRRSGVLLVGIGTPPEQLRGSATAASVEDVVSLPGAEERLLARLTETSEPDRSAMTIAVMSGRGGAGASTLAAALALTAAERRHAAWLVDLDPLGGGVDSVVGAELAAGVRWWDLNGTVGRVSVRALRDAAPAALGVAIVSCDSRTREGPEPVVIRNVLSAAKRGGGVVVLDLPRHPTPAREEVLPWVDRLIVVVPAEVRAVLAARQVVTALERSASGIEVVVRRVVNGLPPHEVSRGMDLPLAGVLDDEQSVRAAGITGSAAGLVGSGALARLCIDLLNGPTSSKGRAA